MIKEKSISIKGTKEGVIIQLPENTPFDEVKERLIEKLNESTDFFKNMKINIIFKGNDLNNLEYSQLVDIIINKTSINCEKIIASINEKSLEIERAPVRDTEFYKGTIRAGQCVRSDKHLVVLGDVNPSAEVIADGNVIVLGHLKGNVQAGYSDNNSAFIVAFSMRPNLIKIGQVIGRASDEERNLKKVQKYSEIAYVKDGQIILEPLDYKTIGNLPIEL
ncbi:septum site-determining protein MinC [Vallitalea okinawensis]|uniref:septum site-determining protein MinC n=1 Tax=Vallitalea okinawensis TaxID=2078660 RepID=UPI000CFAE11C|nr:septum site-determining protein MinC [Vallitalea okinawensis]